MELDQPDQQKKKRRKGTVFTNVNLCKGCGFCAEFCPKNVLRLSEGYSFRGYHYAEVENPEECVACMTCCMMCPDFAVHVEKD